MNRCWLECTKLQTAEPQAPSKEGRILYKLLHFVTRRQLLYILNHLEHFEYVKLPWESKEEDLIQTQISDKDNEDKVSSIISTSARILGKQRHSH